jgi:hypothetical protein
MALIVNLFRILKYLLIASILPLFFCPIHAYKRASCYHPKTTFETEIVQKPDGLLFGSKSQLLLLNHHGDASHHG